jgi:hypothetical protein
MLVTQRSTSPSTQGMVLFKHASDRIHRIQHGMTTSYVFASEEPDYAVKNDVGRYLGTASFGVSDNGRWLVVEVRDSGLVLIDTDDFSQRHIITTGYKYGYGLDPYELLAVSNDGKSVALMGMNVGFSVIDVTPGCGQPLAGDLRLLASTVACPSDGLSIGALFPDFYSAEQPRFFGEGQQLEIIVNSKLGGSRRVTFLKQGATAVHKLKLLSFGDSFTSGEGESDDYYYQPGTNKSFDTCHVSSRAYPFVVAFRQGIATRDVKSVACAGAKVKDIVGSRETYWGQGNRLGVTGLKLSLQDKTTAQEVAIDSIQPGRSLQSSFLDRYNPEAITIGIGGNDAGLMGKLNVCAMRGTCEWAQGEGLRATAREIQRLYGTLGQLFAYISKHSPDARVYIVGYPDIIEADGTCDRVTGFLLDHTERVFIDESLAYLNHIIRAASQHAGFTFLDIEHSMDGKKLCSGSNSTAMNGLKQGDDISIISSLPMLKVISAGTFHPTPIGHALIADTILAGHPGLRQDIPCAIYLVTCSISTESIAPPAYWGLNASSTDRTTYATDFATTDTVNPRIVTVDIMSGTFQPGSIVKMEIRSQPISLATFTIDGNGGLTAVVTLPPDLDIGFHTLHLLGTNTEGSAIDLYQVLTIGQIEERLAASTGGEVRSNSFLPSLHSAASSTMQSLVSEQAPLRGVVATGAVLGAESILSFNPARQPDSSMGFVDSQAIIHTNFLSTIVIAILGILVLMIGIANLLRRRWAKPGS